MARKKPSSGGDQPKKRRPSRRPAKKSEPLELPDRRAMESAMRELAAQMSGQTYPDASPLGQADALVQQAFRERDPRRRVQLAKEALAISPDSADAYVLLAEHSPSRKEALKLYEQGVAAGERAIGPERFQEAVGHFWGVLETRPYMRARAGLAFALWTAGRRDEAVRHVQDMLRLNPNDNQGLRYTLASWLLFLDRDAELETLLGQFDDALAAWAYTRALLAFRKLGDTPESRKLLKKAKKANKYVPDYLLGRKYPPPEQPPYYGLGDENEALIYLNGGLAAWKATAGAIAWLRANDEKAKKHRDKLPQPRGPLDLVKKWLREKLPQGASVWQADVRRFPAWLRGGGVPVRPWVILVLNSTDDLVLGHQILEEEPTAARLWDTVAQAMQHPPAGKPHRPAELLVRADERWETLRPHFEEIGVQLVAGGDPAQTDAVFASMFEHIAGPTEPGLLDVPGVTPELVARFYEAAAFFFRQAPWKKVGYESAIRIEADRFESGPWYGVLMGQSGLTMGLALYEDLKLLRAMWSEDRDDEANARRTVATTVTFGDETETPVVDFDAARRHGWAVARPDAYPSVIHKERGLSMRPPLAWELELLEGCLRAVPEFVNKRGQDDATPETFTVPVASGPLRLTLAWVVDE
jgi:tetratricopeptide (TPR) repeat protein